jgi:hypothetical protein
MKTTTVTLRLEPELKERLQQQAKEEGRTLSGQIAWLLTQKQVKPVEREKPADIPNGVSEQTWADFKRLRAAKKAPITARAIEGIDKEAMQAGMTLEAALRECCARGWTGFKAEWVKNKDVVALLQPSVPYLET